MQARSHLLLINESRRWTPTLEIDKYKNHKRPADDRNDGHIILPLRGFDTVACGRMCCMKLRSAWMIAKKRHLRLDRDTERRRYVYTEIQIDGKISSIGPHWGLTAPSVGINRTSDNQYWKGWYFFNWRREFFKSYLGIFRYLVGGQVFLLTYLGTLLQTDKYKFCSRIPLVL